MAKLPWLHGRRRSSPPHARPAVELPRTAGAAQVCSRTPGAARVYPHGCCSRVPTGAASPESACSSPALEFMHGASLHAMELRCGMVCICLEWDEHQTTKNKFCPIRCGNR